MKLTLANVKELKRNSNSPLTKRVCNFSYLPTMLGTLKKRGFNLFCILYN